MSVGLKGIYTPPPPEDRDIVYLDVSYNGQTYDWAAYIPKGVNVGEHLSSIESAIYSQIDAKESQWSALTPKTKTIFNGDQEVTVDISKEEIVKPDMPDYYALRRAEYPPITDQLGALWKGVDSPEFESMRQKIQEVKTKYPKP